MTAISTTASNLSPKVQAYYDKRFLLRAKPILVAVQNGQKKSMPANQGQYQYFTRYIPLPKRTTALNENTDVGITTPKTLKTQEIAVQVKLYGDFAQISHLASLTSIDPNISEKVDLFAQQMGESLDYITTKEMGTGFMRIRADNDSAYQKVVSASSNGATNGTTIICSSLTEADDYWNGGYVTIIDPTSPSYGETRKVADFAANGDIVTLESAFSSQITSGTKFIITVATGIVSTDVLSSSNLRLALRALKRNKALKMSDNYFRMIVNPDVEYDFMGDDLWVDSATYRDTIKLEEGEIGRWFGIRVLAASSIYREDVNGTENEDGVCHIVPVFGRESYGVIDLENQKQKIYVRTWEQLGQEIPKYNSVGWEAGFAAKVLNGCWGVNIVCGATA